ncbi:TNKS [Branchiostoma lanceolatum]|uniref:TNKS protein n=1 Tax=Branchiostoma lanceolatum TaxID=7740 RepID=A0A8K0AHV3_BRALA|nr:TNKS [Branchiostoma lanceolatum]
MARSVKDLRELICLSRLTIRDSDEEMDFSDTDADFGNLRTSSSLENGDILQYGAGKDAGASILATRKAASVDELIEPHVNLRRSKKAPLPPVGIGSRPSSSASSGSDTAPDVRSVGHDGNFDGILGYMDEAVIADWLMRTNAMVEELSDWCCHGDNFVRFAHFWLSGIPPAQRTQLIGMEVGIVRDEMERAFRSGRESGDVTSLGLRRLLSAVLREYPTKLLTSKGPHIFLEKLDVLTSGRSEEYRATLTDVKVRTRNKQFVQWVLALRAFALLSIWHAAVAFYRTISCPGAQGGLNDDEEQSGTATTDSLEERCVQAVQSGSVDVLHYLAKVKKADLGVRDGENRTLVFVAVTHNQPKVLTYLLTKVHPRPDINLPSCTGNTPLHAAVNAGNAELVKTLVKAGAEVNAANPQCDSATPLHLAVLHGDKETCEVLLTAGAQVTAEMGGQTAEHLAVDLEHLELQQLLQSYTDAPMQT